MSKKQIDDPLLNSLKANGPDYLENIIALLPGHIFWKDLNCRFLGCNDLQAKIAGLHSRQEIVGKSAYDVISKNQSEEDRLAQAKAIDEIDREIMRTGNPLVIEEPLILEDGTERVFLSQKIPLRDKSKNIIGLLGIAIDITEQKKMESDLLIAKEKSDAANYIMTEFISNMGHILVTPFSTITGVATMLLYGFSDKYLELKPYFEELIQGCTNWEKIYRQIIQATSLAEVEVVVFK
ncbi:MAG: PAS domain-containing protein [Nitrosopumilus sp.]|nr:PAS domain-containing protein [Nitrosopumilus sp.]